MLPDQWFTGGGALLALGALLGLGMMFLPRSHKLRRGLLPIVPQLIASAGAGCAVWGWFLARKLLNQWRLEDMPPAAALRDSIDKVIEWKDRLGLLLPVLLLLGLLFSALPIWRSGGTSSPR